eukprot:CAMPEP_0195280626 /NCGR_PEP_ID=MMETSP0707-20130614/240_1 /TAXON_ID=33640 /ORGANISM="Asterionellopsis glacialis, Strain CCMP134" /LENGTH=391 /DNA_ID=CAMNT_0040339401 /DNA_START=157 /DNA_END=1329 /DNA_ORIENTATION=+
MTKQPRHYYSCVKHHHLSTNRILLKLSILFAIVLNSSLGFVVPHRPSVVTRRRGRSSFRVPTKIGIGRREESKNLNARYWEGDDLRWTQKLQRRLTLRRNMSGTPARSCLKLLNVIAFVYQVVNAVQYMRFKYPAYWPRESISMIMDALLGKSSMAPFTTDFAHSVALSRRQPHRYVTAGFLHGNIFHLIANLDALNRLPLWLETGLGWPLYMTTYIVSIITGNYAHTVSRHSLFDRTLCLGASGGICGLYGLMFTALVRMGNSRASARVLRGMAVMLLYGVVFSERISNVSHIGGFLGGIVVGLLCGPTYRKSYTMRRKWSLDVDAAPADYRAAIGFGKMPTGKGFVPLRFVWTCAALYCISQPRFRAIPELLLKGVLRPGSLSGRRFRL